ncbi:unnamed protein product [Rotaria sordida]|uniref:ETS domain-containing protein n=2 Tax=Rotaria sordida TaxID=392033 RepID=A0A816BUE9_9BILA|nr:unnamed protein product [Rotaria sordida]CAF1615221.1 unnamed protein product [Rotaria sordida]
MNELFEYIDGNIFDAFYFNSSVNDYDEIQEGDNLKIYTDLITVENSANNSYKPSDSLNSGGVMQYTMNSPEHTDSPNTSNDSELSSNDKNSLSLNENNDDTEFFNPEEWIVQDLSSWKIRPPKLYEFLRLLLNNPRYVSYISWINKDEGLFKIHKPAKVVHLWKKVKLRRTYASVDYDSFSRAIRYYYKSGLMIKTNRKHIHRFAQK